MIRAFFSIFCIVTVIAFLNSYLQPSDSITNVDAAVAISGGDTNARADEAIRLYQDKLVDAIVFSGAAKDKSGPSNASVMKTRALDAGVPIWDIFIDETSESTEQNAINSDKIFKQQNFRKVILVTSGYHQRRAFLEFSKHASGVRIINNPVTIDKDWSSYWWLSLRGWLLAISEVIKIIAFYVTGIWS